MRSLNVVSSFTSQIVSNVTAVFFYTPSLTSLAVPIYHRSQPQAAEGALSAPNLRDSQTREIKQDITHRETTPAKTESKATDDQSQNGCSK